MGYMDFAIIKCTYNKLNLAFHIKVKKISKNRKSLYNVDYENIMSKIAIKFENLILFK